MRECNAESLNERPTIKEDESALLICVLINLWYSGCSRTDGCSVHTGQTEVIVYIVCRLFPNGRVLYILQAIPERTGAVFPTADHHGELHDEPGGLSHGQAALPSPHWQL